MSDTLQEQEDAILTTIGNSDDAQRKQIQESDWCDDCHGYTHMPWCPSYRAADEISDEEYRQSSSKYQPAARGGGEEWRVAQRYDGVVLIVRAESDNRETPLLTLSKSDDDYVMANRIVTEHNQHQFLVAERESFARLLKAAKFLLAMNATNYDRDVMRSEGGFDALQKAVDTIKKGLSV